MYKLIRNLSTDILSKQPLIEKVETFVQVEKLKGCLYAIALEVYDEDKFKRKTVTETSFFVHFYCSDKANGDLGVMYIKDWFIKEYESKALSLTDVNILHMFRESYAAPNTFDKILDAYEYSILFRVRWEEK